ncbi:GLOBIN domain-containing protein [Favolaschia claudopus]|uniref:GLOBIN domain-containing protein n=1 Tax=Favolaschia claudopus TaxID=2862362 RepID=A0AAV9Z6T7_9AGAR
MAKCAFCGERVSERGLGNHWKKCETRTQRMQISASQALATHSAELAAAATRALEELQAEQAVNDPPPPEIQRSPSPPPRPSGRPGRRTRLPARYRDELPEPPQPLPPPPPVEQPQLEPDPDPAPASTNSPPSWVKTEPNAFGVYKVFPQRPTHDPEDSISLDDLCRSFNLLTPESAAGSADTSNTPPFFPFLNATVAHLMSWFHLGSNLRSHEKLDELVNKVIWSEGWDREHLRGFSAARENRRLDNAVDALPGQPPDGWKIGSVKLKLPAPKVAVGGEAQAVEFEIGGIMYRPLLDVMKEAFQSPAFEQYHITPFELRWDPHHRTDNQDSTMDPTDVDENGLPPLPRGHQALYGEIYTTPSMLKEHNSLPKTAPLHLETIIAAYMFWSDSTYLTNFGDASLWPLYTFFGNQSKYTRAKPTSNACHHQAYLPSASFPFLPDTLIDFYRDTFRVPPSAEVLTHLKRELMHRVWDLLLCPSFIHAYINGVVVKCYDQVERLIFPRFFTYGADYPEKVLLATIKNLGGCPCPRCFIRKDQIADMGSKADMRRRKNLRTDNSSWRQTIERVRGWIFGKGYRVNAAAVDKHLRPESWVPTRNAFSTLAEYGFNLFSMFVPDLLHEVELGVVKAFFTHIVRILYTLGIEAVDELNSRFRQIPTFGRSTIRRFHRNVSDMKKMAARDFEDILQGLLPEPHNGIVITVCFTLATWHAYAKLRLHTDTSLNCFRNTTSELGVEMRRFSRRTCEEYATYELPSEYNRRVRRQAKKNSKTNSSSTAPAQTSKKRKYFNLSTYKWHSVGHYPDIPRVGTTDSVSTQNSELAHRRVKQLYALTNKRDIGPQIAKHERRGRILISMNQRMHDAAAGNEPNIPAAGLTQKLKIADILHPENDATAPAPPYFGDDPAAQNFLPQLKSHLLARLLDLPYDGDGLDFSDQDLLDVTVLHDRIYTHKIMRINFTTYDMGRDQDTINPRTNSDIMVLSHEDEVDGTEAHPYWYARVIGIFHAEVRHVGPKSKTTRTQRMEFLWVRWFGRDMTYKAGWKARRLHRVGFVDFEDGGAFGFLDPSEVIRASHIIPAFHYGPHFQPSTSIHCAPFVDRDMFMRYCDHAVGHRATTSTNCSPGNDPDPDIEDDAEDGSGAEDEGEDSEAHTAIGVDGEADMDSDADEEVGDDDPEPNSSDSEREEEDEDLQNSENGDDPDENDDENDDDLIASYGYDNL